MADLSRMGLEEAEMYARFACEITAQLYEEADECKIAAVQALLEKSQTILKRLIDEHIAGGRHG